VSIAVAVLTHNRLHLLRKCVDNVLARTTATAEIVIWNNASTDDTREYLDSLDDPRLVVVHHQANLGQSGYAEAFRLTESPFLVEVDDDIVDAPEGWDATLLEAFERLPEVGFLAADLEDDPHDQAAHERYRVRPHLYRPAEVNGVRLLEGPAGGGCAITSRELYARVGGFRQQKRNGVFFLEDEAYIRDIESIGYRASVLADLKVLHHGGPYYSTPNPHREAYWARRKAVQARKDAVKRALLTVPLVRPLNARYGWFSASTE
jgi:GT2 family glycosyltransferase